MRARMSDGSERRRSGRFAARIKVGFRSVDELVTAYTEDVSRGGLYVTAAQQLPVGTLVQLQLELPDGGPPARLAAKVAYTLSPEQAQAQGRNPGMGMRFMAEDVAPLAERISEFLARTVGSGEHERPQPIHALVADDSESYRGVLREALEQFGHRVTEAEHGLDALGKAMKEPPDLILTDVTMPVMDGWQLLRLVRSREATSHVPVVFMSTLASERDRIRGYQLGVDDYLEKPMAPGEMVARIMRVVMRSQWERMARDETGEGDSGMSGDLKQVSLASLLAFSEAERRTGWVTVHHQHRRVEIGLREGAIAHVHVNAPEAPTSLLEKMLWVLDWTEGRFSMRESDVPASSESIGVQMTLLEHARRKDEENR